MKIKNYIKQMGDIFSKGIVFGLGFLVILSLAGIAYAATVTTGQTLTATLWNDLVAKVDGISTDLSGNVAIGVVSPAEKLDVNGHIKGIPIVGHWRQSTTRAGIGNFVWDTEIINTNTGYFGWVAGQDYITIKKAGYYEINGDALVYGLGLDERGDVFINKNATALAVSLGQGQAGTSGQFYKHSLHAIDYFNINDKVYLKLTAAGNRYADYWTNLDIIKLN